jgi:hypothetical protein
MPNSEDDALTIVAMIAAIYVLVGVVAVVALIAGGREVTAETAHWKRFDDAHYWDDKAEDWRPYEDRAQPHAAAA